MQNEEQEKKEVATTEVPTPVTHRAHTYEDDVSKAMNATDASVVQELLATAKAREIAQEDYKKSTRQRKWYSLFSTLFIIFAAAAFGYALYHYSQLTVSVQQNYSVGVFPNTDPVVVSDTDIRQTLSRLREDTTLEKDRPLLVPLVSDAATLAPISKQEFFSFIESKPSEPFVAAMEIIRLGIMNTGEENVPFIILSVPDSQIASKEFLIAEPELLQFFYRALSIDISKHLAQIGKEFESTYIYNLPVRILSAVNTETNLSETALLYGYATDHTIVITQKPQVLRSIYDTIIKQR